MENVFWTEQRPARQMNGLTVKKLYALYASLRGHKKPKNACGFVDENSLQN